MSIIARLQSFQNEIPKVVHKCLNLRKDYDAKHEEVMAVYSTLKELIAIQEYQQKQRERL